MSSSTLFTDAMALTSSGDGVYEGVLNEHWVRPKGVAPDVLFALLCGDVSAPVTFGVNRFGWAPTVQLTAYLRARPADGWLRVLCTATPAGDGAACRRLSRQPMRA